MKHIETTLADILTQLAIGQVKVGYEYKRNRMKQIQKSEEFYYGRKIKVPTGRFGVPLPTMSGFVDTLMSKIDDPPNIKFGYTDLADLKLSTKITSAISKDSSSTIGRWGMKDRWQKKLACFSGRGITKYYAESDPKYKSNWDVVDHEDFICEPGGGGYLENHMFLGQDNVFRTETKLKENAEAGIYDKTQVAELIANASSSDHKKNDNLWQQKNERLKKMGLNVDDNTYVGQQMYRLVEWGMEYEGKRYYLLFDYLTGVWVRAHELKEVFESNLWPWESWATHEDPFIFWSKAPCDDVLPIADAIDVLFNQALDNRNKKNMGQRAYDSEMFPDPSELEWRPNGLVRVERKEGQSIAAGVYEFKTEDIQGTIEMVGFMDNYLGRKTGITPETEGVADRDQKVGIYFGSLQQVADRLGLYNKSYNQFWEELGLRYAWGAKEHLTEDELMGMIGEDAIGWDKEKEKAPNLSLTVTGSSAELEANESLSAKRADALMMIGKDPELIQIANPWWRLQEILKHGSYEDDQIKIAMSRDKIGNIELLSEASQAIQDIIKGERVKLNRSANTSYMQTILDYATDHDELTEEKYLELTNFAYAHSEIVAENAKRKSMFMNAGANQQKAEAPISQQGQGIPGQPGGGNPIPGTPGGTQGRSLDNSNALQGATAPIV